MKLKLEIELKFKHILICIGAFIVSHFATSLSTLESFAVACITLLLANFVEQLESRWKVKAKNVRHTLDKSIFIKNMENDFENTVTSSKTHLLSDNSKSDTDTMEID